MIHRGSKSDLGAQAQQATEDIRAAAVRVSDASAAAMGAFLLVSGVSICALVFAVLAYRRTGV